jgi:hypothetical protein
MIIQPFTVGKMKQALAGLDDDIQILFGIPDDLDTSNDWFNVSQDYERPDINEDVAALTFYLKDDYDGRQF